MRPTRRRLIAAGGSALAAGLAGCNESGENSLGDSAGTSESESAADGTTASVETAVAAEWNAMRARVRDALSLGVAGDAGGGAAVAQATFARFEGAVGEHGAHEMLEETDESNYEEFEEALGELRTGGLQAEDLSRAREEATIAGTQLAEAQRTLVGEETARLLDLQLLGASVQDAAFLAAAGSFEAARTTAESTSSRFEDAAVHDALEAAEATRTRRSRRPSRPSPPPRETRTPTPFGRLPPTRTRPPSTAVTRSRTPSARRAPDTSRRYRLAAGTPPPSRRRAVRRPRSPTPPR